MNPRPSSVRRRWLLFAIFLGIVAVGVVDHAAVAGVTFSLFYALLVGGAVLVSGRAPGVAAAALAVLVWEVAEVFSGEVSGEGWVPIWNAVVRFGYLILVVVGAGFVERVRSSRQPDWDDSAPPLCTCCRRMREPAGAWVDIESFLADQYDIRPEPKICPDCAKRIYADRVGPGSAPPVEAK